MAQLDINEISQDYRVSIQPRADPAEQAHRHRQERLATTFGALLTTGCQTLTTILRRVHPYMQGQISSSHRVFSPRRWSAWGLARRLISLLLDHVVPPGPVWLAGDDPGTERPGPMEAVGCPHPG